MVKKLGSEVQSHGFSIDRAIFARCRESKQPCSLPSISTEYQPHLVPQISSLLRFSLNPLFACHFLYLELAR